MAQQAFTATLSNALLSQPSASGEKLIFRSTSSADTMNLSIHGNVSAAYSSETNALTGQIEKETSASFETLLHALLASSSAGSVSIFGQGTKGAGYVIFSSNPADGETLTIGLTGNTRVYTFKATLTGAANEVKIGAANTDTADNFKRAINDEGVENTNYGTGTTINEYLTATISTITVTLTDKLACKRRLGWTISQSASSLSLQAPIGGVDGTELARMTAGVTQAADDITLDNEDLSLANLIAGLAFQSDWITLHGGPATLILNVAGANMTFTYKTRRIDGGVEYDGLTSISAVGSSTPLVVNLSENAIQQIQLRVTNGGSTARNIAAYVVHPDF